MESKQILDSMLDRILRDSPGYKTELLRCFVEVCYVSKRLRDSGNLKGKKIVLLGTNNKTYHGILVDSDGVTILANTHSSSQYSYDGIVYELAFNRYQRRNPIIYEEILSHEFK